MTTYTTRPNKNGQYIDIVHTNAGPGAGSIVRVPVRCGMEDSAGKIAQLVLNFLNEYQRCLELKQGQPTINH
jgi:hypothetical protein